MNNETLGDVLKEYKKNGKEYIYIGDLCFEIDKCFDVEEDKFNYKSMH